jgi:1,4-dihydroxy-2-naphthoate octaprenyltransferase
MSDLKLLFGPMRLPFLILTPACVLLGIATAVSSSAGVNAFHIALVIAGAIAAHISVNAFNELGDFKSGLDFTTRRTPFSGGSGTLPERPDLARQVSVTAWVSLVATCLVGLSFLIVGGLLVFPLGIAGVVVVFRSRYRTGVSS